MKSVIFKPWIGPLYKESNRKILIVGDSHYCGDCDERCGVRGNLSPSEMGDCVNFTNDVIQAYLKFLGGDDKDWARWMSASFLKFDKIFLGKQDVSKEEREALWNNVSFYNYVQTAIAKETSNTVYTPEDYTKSAPMFFEVLEELRPDFIIVWGKKAYNAMPADGWTNDDNKDSGYYTLSDDHKVRCMAIYHPTIAGFDEWSTKVADFLRT